MICAFEPLQKFRWSVYLSRYKGLDDLCIWTVTRVRIYCMISILSLWRYNFLHRMKTCFHNCVLHWKEQLTIILTILPVLLKHLFLRLFIVSTLHKKLQINVCDRLQSFMHLFQYSVIGNELMLLPGIKTVYQYKQFNL